MNATIEHAERFAIDGRPGYFLDGWGYEFFDPEAVDADDVRRRLDALIEEIGESEKPFISLVAIDGRLPTQRQVEAVESELAKAPANVVRDFRDRGGRIELVCGQNARLHPFTANRRNHRSCGGWFCDFHKLIAIAVESDPLSVLHELAHHYDRDGGRFSCLPRWRQICMPGPWESRFDSPSERFAEAFAMHWHSMATRDRLGDTVQQFIERVCA